MRVAMPWLHESDIPAARAWAQPEILADLAFSHLRKEGVLQATGENAGEPRRLLADFRSLRSVQIVYARELGMTPAARNAMRHVGSLAHAHEPRPHCASDDRNNDASCCDARAAVSAPSRHTRMRNTIQGTPTVALARFSASPRDCCTGARLAYMATATRL